MKIEHVALYVKDLEGARKFFEKYFCAKSGGLYHNRTSDFKSYFLTFDGGARLEIMTRPEIQNVEKILYTQATPMSHSALEAKRQLTLLPKN